jgi:hypothetical protein
MSDAGLKRGPILDDLLAAQDEAEAAVDYPVAERWASALAELSCELGNAILWPVSGPAERLAGVAVVAGRGNVRVRSLSRRLDGEQVLLVEVIAVTPLQLLAAAMQARSLGAEVVHGCALRIASEDGCELLDSYTALGSRMNSRTPVIPRIAAVS